MNTPREFIGVVHHLSIRDGFLTLDLLVPPSPKPRVDFVAEAGSAISFEPVNMAISTPRGQWRDVLQIPLTRTFTHGDVLRFAGLINQVVKVSFLPKGDVQ